MARWILGFVLIMLLALILLSLVSRKEPKTGLVEERLRACPDTPNCVCSEDASKASFVEPLTFSGSPEKAWESTRQLVCENGGKIKNEQKGYLWATFTTKVFRFVDDVELRMDETNKVIHIRSASRVGYADMGMNSKRVEDFRARFNNSY